MNYHEFQACNQGELCMQVKDIFKQKFKTLDGYPLQHPIVSKDMLVLMRLKVRARLPITIYNYLKIDQAKIS